MTCVVSGCNSNSRNSRRLGEDLSFHVFPKNDELRKKWFIATNRTEKQFNKHWKVCSKHFNPKCFLGPKCGAHRRVFFTEEAVPTLNLPTETHNFNVHLGDASANVSHQQSSMSECCPALQQTTNVNRQQSPIPIRLIRSPLTTSCPNTPNTNMSQNQSDTNVLTDMASKNLMETIKSQQTKIAVYQGQVDRLEERVQHLESIAKYRLLKGNRLHQQCLRLKKKNIPINNKLIELLEKRAQNNGLS